MSTPPIEPSEWAEGPVRAIISGRFDAQRAMEAVLRRARRRIQIFDHHFKDRGYNSPARIDMLRSFLVADRGNLIQIALHQPDSLVTDCPRLVALTQQFPMSLRVHRTLGAAREANDPLLIADDAHYWHHLHHEHPRSVLSLEDLNAAAPLIERFEQIWELSEPVSPGSALGL